MTVVADSEEEKDVCVRYRRDVEMMRTAAEEMAESEGSGAERTMVTGDGDNVRREDERVLSRIV